MQHGHKQRSSILSLQNVGFCYSKRTKFFRKSEYWALKDITFEVYRGETLGVLGRNGAGKSTLLRILAGIFDQDRGLLSRERGCRASLLSLQVGFVPDLNGYENAILSGMLLGLSRKEVEARIPAIREFADLGDFFEQPLRTYSSGMRARLGFAVAFQADPDILLIDEVLGVGDAKFKTKSAEAMKDKIASDKTVILVSHNAQTMLELCDRIVWIEDGKTAAQGKPREVLHQYRQAMQIQSQSDL